MILIVGALLGLVSVAFGAYAAHGLAASVSAEVFDSVQTAVRFNQVHAVVVTAIGMVRLSSEAVRQWSSLAWAAWGFAAGTVLFSFSIYLSAATSTPALNAAAPIGGTVLMASWLMLAWTGIRSL